MEAKALLRNAQPGLLGKIKKVVEILGPSTCFSEGPAKLTGTFHESVSIKTDKLKLRLASLEKRREWKDCSSVQDLLTHTKKHNRLKIGSCLNNTSLRGLFRATMRRLRLSKAEAAQQYRRMIFNVFARNQDDHTKNIAFLMNQDGKWCLAPAFDMTCSHNPAGIWTNQHQMSINGKRDHFRQDDLTAVGEGISLPRPDDIIGEIADAVRKWPIFAEKAGLNEEKVSEISRYHRLDI